MGSSATRAIVAVILAAGSVLGAGCSSGPEPSATTTTTTVRSGGGATTPSASPSTSSTSTTPTTRSTLTPDALHRDPEAPATESVPDDPSSIGPRADVGYVRTAMYVMVSDGIVAEVDVGPSRPDTIPFAGGEVPVTMTDLTVARVLWGDRAPGDRFELLVPELDAIELAEDVRHLVLLSPSSTDDGIYTLTGSRDDVLRAEGDGWRSGESDTFVTTAEMEGHVADATAALAERRAAQQEDTGAGS